LKKLYKESGNIIAYVKKGLSKSNDVYEDTSKKEVVNENKPWWFSVEI
jgi:hypothetical protein